MKWYVSRSSGSLERRDGGRGQSVASRASALCAVAILGVACTSAGTAAPGSASAPADVQTAAPGSATSGTAPTPAGASTGASTGTTSASAAAPAGNLKLTPGPDLCTLLGPDDFTAAGVPGATAASKNNPDPNDFYCVYAGKSSATGGIEFDASIADPPPTDDSGMPVAPVFPDVTADVPGADRARYQADPPVIGVRSGNLIFNIGFPTSPTAQAAAIALAKLVLSRAAALGH